MQSLLRFELPAQFAQSEAQSTRGMQSILEMLEYKKKARYIASQANIKPKAFF